VRIANDPGQTRSAGARLRAAGSELLYAAGGANPGSGAGGDATPRTDAALRMLGSEWTSGLRRLGEQVEALGRYADMAAAAYERAGN
jgi:hypothetical protein